MERARCRRLPGRRPGDRRDPDQRAVPADRGRTRRRCSRAALHAAGQAGGHARRPSRAVAAPEIAHRHAPRAAASRSGAGQAPASPPSAARTPAEIITDIQRELARRGFYDGAVDGRYGPRTDAAIRDFEQAAGLKPSAEPNEALLRAITRSPAKLAKAASAAGARGARAGRPQRSASPDRPAPSKRVVAVQRALAEYGYGQIKPTGIVDPRDPGSDREIRARAQAAGHRPAIRPGRARARGLTGRPLE